MEDNPSLRNGLYQASRWVSPTWGLKSIRPPVEKLSWFVSYSPTQIYAALLSPCGPACQASHYSTNKEALTASVMCRPLFTTKNYPSYQVPPHTTSISPRHILQSSHHNFILSYQSRYISSSSWKISYINFIIKCITSWLTPIKHATQESRLQR